VYNVKTIAKFAMQIAVNCRHITAEFTW